MSHNIREIYTKAIVAKGKKLSRITYNFTLNHFPDDILGCWITNHHYEAAIKNKIPKMIGTFDVHIWYSYHDEMDSIVEKHQVTYIDDMQVTKKEDREFESSDQVKGRCLNKPKCLSASHNGKDVTMEIEKEMQIEILKRLIISSNTLNLDDKSYANELKESGISEASINALRKAVIPDKRWWREQNSVVPINVRSGCWQVAPADCRKLVKT